MRAIWSHAPTWFLMAGTFLLGVISTTVLEKSLSSSISWIVGLGVTALMIAIGAVWQWRRAKRLGIYLSVFAIAKEHEDVRAGNQAKMFGAWVRKKDPNAKVSDPITQQVIDHDQMIEFASAVRNEICKERPRVPGGYPVTLMVGGRLDACFALGERFRSITGLPGPIWLMSDSSVDYLEPFALCAGIRGESEGAAGLDPDQHPMKLGLPRRRASETPAHFSSVAIDSLPDTVVVNARTFADTVPVSAIYCRDQTGDWVPCEHKNAHASVILAYDSEGDASVRNRIATSLNRTPDFPVDPVLALTATKGLGKHWDAFHSLFAELEAGVIAGRLAATETAKLYVALACPSAVAVALGARLNTKDVTWEPLQHVKGQGYVRTNL